jgi:hypothetical protein
VDEYLAALYNLNDEELKEWDKCSVALLEVGRNGAPRELSRWWRSRAATVPVLRALIVEVWHLSEDPVPAIGESRWLELWKAAGFVSDTGRAPPAEPMTLYRGALVQTQGRGMSWTFDQERARWFAQRLVLFVPGSAPGVFRATVPPKAVLAMITEARGESEVVVDPGWLHGRAAPVQVESAIAWPSQAE